MMKSRESRTDTVKKRGKMSKVIKEFSRFAHQYDQHNEIQTQVAKTLVSNLSAKTYENILDLGCGSGAVAKNLQEGQYNYDTLTAFDSSQAMLDIHPSSEKISKVCGDFNSIDFTKYLPKNAIRVTTLFFLPFNGVQT